MGVPLIVIFSTSVSLFSDVSLFSLLLTGVLLLFSETGTSLLSSVSLFSEVTLFSFVVTGVVVFTS